MPKHSKCTDCAQLARRGARLNSGLYVFLMFMLADTGSYLPAVLREHHSNYRKEKDAIFVTWASLAREARRQKRADLASDLLVVEVRFNRQQLKMLDLFRSYLASCREAGGATLLYPTGVIYRDFPHSRSLIVPEFLPASEISDILFDRYNICKGKTSARILRAAERDRFRRQTGRPSVRDQAATVSHRQPQPSQGAPCAQVLDAEQKEWDAVCPQSIVSRSAMTVDDSIKPSLCQGSRAAHPLDAEQKELGVVSPQSITNRSAVTSDDHLVPSSIQGFGAAHPLDADQTEPRAVSYWSPSYYQPSQPVAGWAGCCQGGNEETSQRKAASSKKRKRKSSKEVDEPASLAPTKRVRTDDGAGLFV